MKRHAQNIFYIVLFLTILAGIVLFICKLLTMP